MTRFARAKGSKASNEKAPEDGTPWEVMKEQLLRAKKDNEDSKKREEAEKQRIENYENFLKEQKVQKRKAEWCDFPETAQIAVKRNNEPASKKKKKKVNGIEPESPSPSASSVGDISQNKKEKKKKNTNKETSESDHATNVIDNEEIGSNNKKNKKKNNQKKNQTVDQELNNEAFEVGNENAKKKAKKQKNKNKVINDSPNENPHTNNENSTDQKQPIANGNKPKPQKKKKTKFVDGKPVRRKDINDRSFQLIINGKDVELKRFEGFPVMKKDAERLEELKKDMMKKGIPKSEVQRTIKLERRRAEKALARMKRDVCYNCRKGGHNLSDCPELKSKIPGANAADGVCFKCGSTEHRQFECKVQRDKEFRFATCFICKEPGHIARQCPDNPKGLYPNGGSCKLCGDVTHLRKDCPTINSTKEETSVKLQTLESSNNLEDIGPQFKTNSNEDTTRKPKKIRF